MTPSTTPVEQQTIHRRIKGYGPAVLLPHAAQQPRRGAKVLFEITMGAKAGEVNRGLDRVARLLNLYAGVGLGTNEVQVAVVLHGEATRAALDDKSFAQRFGTETNPNLPLLRELKKAGVELYVCGQALDVLKFPAEEVVADVVVAVAGMTVVINKQMDGYVYISIP